ncbi:MAG: ribosome silencing factor [Chthonomonadales bacterium]
MTAEDKAQLIVEAADNKIARDITLLDLRGLTLMTDYFFICCGTSTTHIRTICDGIKESMKEQGAGGMRIEGFDAAVWILMDYGDVVVHIMNPEQREYYDIESFWGEAKRVDVSLPEHAA